MNHLKPHPQLSSMSVKTGHDRLLVVWYVLRYLDGDGSGWLPDTPQTVAAIAATHGTKRNVRALLKSGDSVFWAREHGAIKLHGLRRIVEYLCELTGERPTIDRPVLVPVELLDGTLQQRRAILYAVWIAGGKNGQRRIGREYVAAKFGVSEQTLRNWEALANITVAKTHKWLPVASQRPDAGYDYEALPSAEGAVVVRKQGQPDRLVWDGPNQYSTALQRAPRGMSRKVAVQTRFALDFSVRVKLPTRRYYSDMQALAKARSRQPYEQFYLQTAPNLWEVCPAYAR